jgi:hypothetical protein
MLLTLTDKKIFIQSVLLKRVCYITCEKVQIKFWGHLKFDFEFLHSFLIYPLVVNPS